MVGVLFLSFTVTFFIGNTLIHSYFSSAAKPASTLITGVLLIGLSGLADAAVGLAMRPVLTPYAPVRAQIYFALRVAEGLAVLAACAYFLTSHSHWNDYPLPAYALSAVAGLVLTPVLLTSRLVPRSLSLLGIAGYALLLAGVVCNLLGIADIGWHVSPAGIVFLAPGGLFELLFPLLLIIHGFSPGTHEGTASDVGHCLASAADVPAEHQLPVFTGTPHLPGRCLPLYPALQPGINREGRP